MTPTEVAALDGIDLERGQKRLAEMGIAATNATPAQPILAQILGRSLGAEMASAFRLERADSVNLSGTCSICAARYKANIALLDDPTLTIPPQQRESEES